MYFFIESEIQEYGEITKFYIERIITTLYNHIINNKKFIQLEDILNNSFKEEFLNSIDLQNCNLIHNLFEALIERFSIKYTLLPVRNSKRMEKIYESAFKM